MNTRAQQQQSNDERSARNARLRQLVEGAGLSQAEALTIFNQELGPAAYSGSAWKAFFVSPETTRFRALSDRLLAHAEKVFEKLQKVRQVKNTRKKPMPSPHHERKKRT